TTTLGNQATNDFVCRNAPTRNGTTHPHQPLYQHVAGSDGVESIAVGNESQFPAQCGAQGMEVENRRATNALPVAERDALGQLIAAKTAGLTMQELMQALEAAGVPCGPVNTIDQVCAEPQAIHRGLTVEQTRPDLADPVRTIASPIRLSKTPVRYDAPPPKLGQDTEDG